MASQTLRICLVISAVLAASASAEAGGRPSAGWGCPPASVCPPQPDCPCLEDAGSHPVPSPTPDTDDAPPSDTAPAAPSTAPGDLGSQFQQPFAQQPFAPPAQPFGNQLTAATSPRSVAPNMIGDSLVSLSPILTHMPPGPSDESAVSLYSLHQFKVSEDESPWPRNRVYAGVSSFNNVPGTEDLTRFIVGFEKTFMDGDASIGVRIPIWMANPEPIPAGVRGFPFGAPSHSTAFGDLTVTLKGALLNDGKRDVLTAGLSVTAPTGPETYGGVNPFYSIDDVDHKGTIQPWIGWYHTFDAPQRGLFTQGFLAYDYAFDSDDSHLFYIDLGLGYRIPRQGMGFITAVTPMFEAHWTNPLHNRSQSFTPTPLGNSIGFPSGGIFAYRHQVNLTMAVNLEIRKSSSLALGVVLPTVGPRYMDFELIAQMNVFDW